MDPIMFFSTLLFTILVVSIAMLYLRRTTRKIIVELCKSEAGAEFWLRSADILAYSGALMLVLIFGYDTNAQDWIDAIRITLILTLGGVFVTVMFVARNVWKTVAPRTGAQS
ncbi:MAG TPA: hypothetical protein VFP33_06000 [Gallionella sp.]|nr:hypothetical protein [Gallionella sp.]